MNLTPVNDDLYYTKENVSLAEYEMHQKVFNLNIVHAPRVISYNATTKQMVMERVCVMNVSDWYGDDANVIHEELFDRIRAIIQILYDHNILYRDITGYNFLEESSDKLWIIDFEHATYHPTGIPRDDFVNAFLDGMNKWNPEFA